MKPIWRFGIDCTCGSQELVGISQAGAAITCTNCECQFNVPSLSELKQLSPKDVSAIGRLEDSIRDREVPFDGNCQLCSAFRGDSILQVYVVAFRDEDEFARTFRVPCVLCHSCKSEFKRGIWTGRLQSLGAACLKALWLLIALIVASIIAFLLPLIGIVAVVAFSSSLFFYLTRKRANPFVRRHLNRICDVEKLLVNADRYVFRFGQWIAYEE